MASGKPLHVRKILEDAGGGSVTTVREEIAVMLPASKAKASTLVGAGATKPPARIAALEEALDSCIDRERLLQAENEAQRESLAKSRSELEKLLSVHQDSQRLLLQGVDDLRQMVKAGQGGLPPGIIAAERAKYAPKEETGDSLYWQAKHDQLLTRFIELERKFRAVQNRLAELGEAWD